jgi:hypothetical protein
MYYSGIYTIPILCSLSLLTVPNTDINGSSMSFYSYALTLIMICSKLIIVPVLPIPALQCTTAFSFAPEFNINSINSSRVLSKSSFDSPEGIP